MTLVEFLIARITEDFEDASWIHSRDCDTYTAAQIGGFPCNCPWPARIEREAKIKREIVEATDTAGYQDIGVGNTSILRAMARLYADHPDYMKVPRL